MIVSGKTRPFRLTLVHPCVGRRVGMKKYIRTWMMEPISPAVIAALTPNDVEKRFYDDRLESIPYDEPSDLVAISVETYTAKRSYQIAHEYRRRGVPVVMGGFHATLCPDEVAQFCDSIVIGEAEELFPQIIDDYRHGRPECEYRSETRPRLSVMPDRSIFHGKDYLSVRLIEFARGCRFKCDFCAIQSYFNSTHSHRPIDHVIDEVQQVRDSRQLIFFVDDNLTSDLDQAKELMRALIPLQVRWVSQSAINVAWDDEALDLMKRSGCQGVLVGFESLDSVSLSEMNKGFNQQHGGPTKALQTFRRHNIRVYGTFIFGYDHDTPASFDQAVDFAKAQGLFIAAFNHITPFPGTPLYQRLEAEDRLHHEAWWLADDYRYNMVPFQPKQMTPKELADGCVAARRSFYSWPSILRRATRRVNWRSPTMLATYFAVNAMHRRDVDGRNGLPLGDQAFDGSQSEASSRMQSIQVEV
jgi:radical SAM superfamily enzyme YgiQ (UPF0313 family)